MCATFHVCNLGRCPGLAWMRAFGPQLNSPPTRIPRSRRSYLVIFPKSARTAFTFFSSSLQKTTPVSLLSW